jgi:ABC-type Fe3+-hydroxamate transport system substrate-binding protein
MMDPSFWYTGFYEEISGVPARDNYALPTLGAHDKLNQEYIYELDPDLFALDPNRFITSYGLGESDLDAMEKGVAPFFGNHSRADRGGSWPNYPSGDSYRYYSIPEYVDKYGELFGEQERASDLVEFYEETMADIVSNVPDETPTIALLSAFANPENFGYFGVDNPTPDSSHSTYARKQYRDLGVQDAFAGEYGDKNSESEDLQIDAEKLAAVDPDTIIFREGIRFVDVDESKLSYGNLYEQTLDIIKSDPVTSEITAVKEGNLFVGGTDNQGPIINLFQTEMLAKQLYPETFGEWHGVGETPAEEELVDRDRLAEIITGSA